MTMEDEDGVGSFRHYVGKDDSLKQDSTYEVYVPVHSVPLLCHNSKTGEQIAGYRAGRNVISNDFSDENFNVLGDIDTICINSIIDDSYMTWKSITDAASLQ